MNDPQYIQTESDFDKDKEDAGFDFGNNHNLDMLYTERNMVQLDTERDLVGDDDEKNAGISKGIFSNDKITKSTTSSIKSKSLRKEGDSSFRSVNENQSLISGSTVRKGGSFSFDEELKRLQTINKIEKKLKRSGTKPESILMEQPKRGFLDRLKIPRKFRINNRCCNWKLNFLFMLMIVAIVDSVLLLKQVILMLEMTWYKESYPELIKVDNICKFVIFFMLFITQVVFILNKIPKYF